jgi:hypothetical protein
MNVYAKKKTFHLGKLLVLCFTSFLVLIRISSLNKHFEIKKNWNGEQVNEYESFTDEDTNQSGSASSSGI